MNGAVVILGLGFTTQRLARLLRRHDVPVYALVRAPERFAAFEAIGVRLVPFPGTDLPVSAVWVHSVPPLDEPGKSALRGLIRQARPRRIVYISSTGVYGAQTHVSADSVAQPNDEKGRARLHEEQWITQPGDAWTSLILRSAAIYGPGRGIHVRLREGKTPRGAGGMVSRIHVDDLAAVLKAGIKSNLTGIWPVADDCPASSEEVAAWCAELMGIPLPDSALASYPVAGRVVDGGKLLKLLGVELKHATYRTGIPASLRDELIEKTATTRQNPLQVS